MNEPLLRAGVTALAVLALFLAVAAFHRDSAATSGQPTSHGAGVRAWLAGYLRPVVRLRQVLFWCALLLLLVLLFTDMPDLDGDGKDDGWGQLSSLWADHSVWSGLLTTLATAGVAYFLWRHNKEVAADNEARRQRALAETVSAAGLAGIVDHVVDAELLLALVSLDERQLADKGLSPRADGTVFERKESLRGFREMQPRDQSEDVRLADLDHADLTPAVWRVRLVDLAVRRLAKAMNDWSPLIAQSTYGRAALHHLAMIRIDLIALQTAFTHDRTTAGDDLVRSLASLRGRLRFFALFFEYASGVGAARPEVLGGRVQAWLHQPEPETSGIEVIEHFPAFEGLEQKGFEGRWNDAWVRASAELGLEPWRMGDTRARS